MKVLCSTLGGMSPKPKEDFHGYGGLAAVNKTESGSVWVRLYSYNGEALGVWLTPESWEALKAAGDAPYNREDWDV